MQPRKLTAFPVAAALLFGGVAIAAPRSDSRVADPMCGGDSTKKPDDTKKPEGSGPSVPPKTPPKA